jgi:hypothetical protein
MIATSDIKVSALVNRDEAVDALRALHAAFELDKAPVVSDAAANADEGDLGIGLIHTNGICNRNRRVDMPTRAAAR